MSETWEYGEATVVRDTGLPWPPAEDGPILAAFGIAWKSATFDPSSFFSDVPRETGTGPAIIYYLAVGIFVAGAALFWDSMALFSGAMADESLTTGLGVGAVSPVVRFLLSPALLLGGLFVSAGVVHLLLLIFDGADHGFGTTVRVFCYAYSPAVFGVVPILGPLVGSLWSVVLVIIGLREAHEAPGWKPAVAVLVPFIGAVTLLLLAFAALMVAGGALPG